MLSPEEAFDPIRFSDELVYWENEIDAHLKKYFDGTSEMIKFRFQKGEKYSQVDQGVIELLIKMYAKAGWKIIHEKIELEDFYHIGHRFFFKSKKNWWK